MINTRPTPKLIRNSRIAISIDVSQFFAKRRKDKLIDPTRLFLSKTIKQAAKIVTNETTRANPVKRIKERT